MINLKHICSPGALQQQCKTCSYAETCIYVRTFYDKKDCPRNMEKIKTFQFVNAYSVLIAILMYNY